VFALERESVTVPYFGITRLREEVAVAPTTLERTRDRRREEFTRPLWQRAADLRLEEVLCRKQTLNGVGASDEGVVGAPRRLSE
jgi:hypothetical protein